mmetsp:Transcript_59187/g.155797  ORF Transcript_59187/g.155797 Transcript_59187/m.155797 type:complete len:230 (+) Transcript_59187:1756-2445(+)
MEKCHADGESSVTSRYTRGMSTRSAGAVCRPATSTTSSNSTTTDGHGTPLSWSKSLCTVPTRPLSDGSSVCKLSEAPRRLRPSTHTLQLVSFAAWPATSAINCIKSTFGSSKRSPASRTRSGCTASSSSSYGTPVGGEVLTYAYAGRTPLCGSATRLQTPSRTRHSRAGAIILNCMSTLRSGMRAQANSSTQGSSTPGVVQWLAGSFAGRTRLCPCVKLRFWYSMASMW